ncbi:hypothetical protein R1sor_003164 [Riccia sorocarpa]|uniref:Vps72/YL1 C-terminal domain-containing protein n=1 Tax=Riccia sorocarpa TaxID=122646 RepID=A0ABD3H0T3_9MARC
MNTDGLLDRSARASRGKRLSRLLEEEAEADEEFWNQEAFQEEAEDNEYERNLRKQMFLTVTLTRMYEPEEDEGEQDEVERPAKKKKLLAGKPDKKKADKKKKVSSREKKEEEDRKLTQEDMLLEAAQTVVTLNLHTLEIMLACEEEVKRKAVVHKQTYDGPLITFHSSMLSLSAGVNTLVFTRVEEFPDILSSPTLTYPKKVLCVITGQPARYRDPKTGQPYATKEAFKLIRERFTKGDNTGRKKPDEPHQRKRTKVERERPGPGGRANVAKLKFKKSSPSVPSSDTLLDLSFSPELVSNKAETSSLPLNSMSNELPALKMLEPISEANEADFLLDDLGVCLPYNLDSSLSLPTSSGISPMLLDNNSGNGEAGETSLGREMIGLGSEQDQTLLSMDIMTFSDDLYDPSTQQGKIP